MDAGWYPDPQNPAYLRFWDGANWTEHVQPAAPVAPAWGTAPRPGTPGWGAAGGAAQPVRSAAPSRRQNVSPLAGLLVVGALVAAAFVGVYAYTADKASPDSAPTVKVVKLFNDSGVVCTEPQPDRSPDDVAGDAIIDIPARFETRSGRISQGQMADLMNTASALQEFAATLPDGDLYAWMHCGESWLLVNATSTFAVAIGPESEGLAEQLDDLGLSEMYQLPTGV